MYFLLVAGLFINSCNGQVNSNNTNGTTYTSNPKPGITGTPPRPVYVPGVPFDSNLVSQYIRSIFQDSKGNFWFGPVGYGVIRYDGETLHYYSNAEFFQGNDSIFQGNDPSVHAIAEDKKGNMWFGTNDGAIKYDGTTFTRYTEKNGLANIYIGRKSILVDKAGTVWVGTQCGVFQYNPSADSLGGKCFSLFQLLPSIQVRDIMEDKAGNIWFASSDNGVYQFDGKKVTNISEKEGLGDNYAGGIAQDKAGNMWFTMKDGICKFDPSAYFDSAQHKSLRASGKNFTEYTTKDGLGRGEVWGIYIEESGIIWITARGSTTRFDPSMPLPNQKAFTVFTPDDGINCCVQSMYQDKSGNMWWGAGSGLYRFDGKRFYQVKQAGPW